MASKSVNSIEVKKMNRNTIYKFLYRREPMSIQEISYSLKMSLPTVTQNIKELQEKKLVVETGLFESTGGRKAKSIAYNPGAKYSIGLDITRNHISIVIVDLSGEVIKTVRHQYPFINNNTYFEGVGKKINDFITEAAIDKGKILGVGIALPAIISSDDKTVDYAVFIDFKGGSVKQFEQYIPFPCVLCNDANAAGFAELWGSQDNQDMVYLSLNNSVGGSIISNNKIYTGKNQRGGEFGHMTIVPDGVQCYCGQRGCVDAYCSAKVLSDSTNGDISEFFKLLKQGKQPQQQIWENYVNKLVLTVNNLRMIFDCNVILGGYAGSYMEDYIDELRLLVSRVNTFEKDGLYLRVCKYKLETTAVGAALFPIERFIDSI